MDDEEVAGEVELCDEVELALELVLRPGGERLEAASCPFPRLLPQPRRRRLARGELRFGEAVAEVGEREREAVGEVGRAGDGPGKVAEEGGHLFRPFQVSLRARLEEAAGRIDRGVVADAGEDVEEVLVAPAGIAGAVRGDEGEAMRAGEVEENGIAGLLVADPVPLQLDVETARKECREAREELARGVGPDPLERAEDRPLEPA